MDNHVGNLKKHSSTRTISSAERTVKIPACAERSPRKGRINDRPKLPWEEDPTFTLRLCRGEFDCTKEPRRPPKIRRQARARFRVGSENQDRARADRRSDL